ncbi:flavodoxin family protein [Acetobacterium woodii]|uniref:Iron-sulfur flavoprotein n=1 Tax=Acetobacterium woodii (strain ATCC 29683 / DSM 1030 / JCM 2381 / KCTC 1655 / WB1) TaxID=931626 RepID=H6LCE4_ACEWD|nr:flavodoxin family protein [Acetobacterium woodii]AFA50259.1 iron-sulfur flavoprotein [Acetobacterium woodii DSM 1030]
MEIVAILGSHRNGQNTQKALDHFMGQIKVKHELFVYNVNKIDVQACLACDYCIPHQGECVIKDDMTEIYQKMETCDLLIVASPVYFSALPSKIKALIDRTQMIYNLKDRSHISKKKILIIGVGGAPHYPRQFQAIDNTLEWYKKTLKCEEVGFVQFSHTDELSVPDNIKCLKELDEIAEKINTPIG